MPETIRKFSPDTDGHCYRCKCRLVAENDMGLTKKGLPPLTPREEELIDLKQPIRAKNDALTWEGHMGYFSDEADGDRRGIVLCDVCTKAVLGQWMKWQDAMYPPHYGRHLKRDEAEIKQQWKARHQKRKLKQQLPQATRESIKLKPKSKL